MADGWEDAPVVASSAKPSGGMWEEAPLPAAPKKAAVTATAEPSTLQKVSSGLDTYMRYGTPQGLAATGLAEVGKHISGAAYDLGGAVTDALSSGRPSIVNPAGIVVAPELAAGAGYLTNLGVETLPVALGGTGARGVAEEKGKELGRRWMQQALKPSKAELESGRAEKGIETVLQRGESVSQGGVDKLNRAIDELQTEMVASLKGNPNVAEPHKVVKELDSVFDTYRKQATPTADLATIQKALNEFINHPLISKSGVLDLETANAIKSGTYRAIGDAGYGAGLKPAAERDALKGIARGLQREMAAQPGVPAGVGHQQADLINARNLIEDRILMAGNRGELGFSSIAPHLWQIPAALIDRSPMAKGYLARQAYHGTLPAAIGETAGGATGVYMGTPAREQRR